MFDQLLNESYDNAPSFPVALFSLLLAFVLSTVIGITYRFTVSAETFSRNFFQAIVLSSMVSSMVIMAVGDNIAVGFGIIGAIAIIRFRTNMRNPRNIIFIFAALSVGVATGVYGYSIALAGTLVFCVVAILLRLSSFGKDEDFFFEVTVTMTSAENEDQIYERLKTITSDLRKLTVRSMTEDRKRLQFSCLMNEDDMEEVYSVLQSVDGVDDVRVERRNRDLDL